jgi:trans-AT polyketide synthase/acyltransferase/oxidoreductase domain-containing protein
LIKNNALFAAGVFDFITGLKLVQKRGAIMSRVEGGGMAAVLGMDSDTIKQVLVDSGNNNVDVANFNSPKQTVLSGLKEDVVKAEQAFKDAGAKRYIVLPVSGAFHSRHMQNSQDEFAEFASQFDFVEPRFPVIANLTAKSYEVSEILSTLVGQISNSVRWVESIREIKSNGEFDFEELGPKKVLTSLLRQI